MLHEESLWAVSWPDVPTTNALGLFSAVFTSVRRQQQAFWPKKQRVEAFRSDDQNRYDRQQVSGVWTAELSRKYCQEERETMYIAIMRKLYALKVKKYFNLELFIDVRAYFTGDGRREAAYYQKQ